MPSAFRLNFSMDDQNSIFTCPVFDLTFRHGQAYSFLWTTKFQSGQVNPKSYLPSLATKVCGSVCSTAYIENKKQTFKQKQEHPFGSCGCWDDRVQRLGFVFDNLWTKMKQIHLDTCVILKHFAKKIWLGNYLMTIPRFQSVTLI